MKKYLCVALLVLSLLFCGCNAVKKDHFAPLRDGFSAQLEGVFRDVPFGARLSVVKTEEGAREATLTFYAPKSLADTVLTCNGDGVRMTVGGVTLAAPATYEAFFAPFLSESEPYDVTVEKDVTRVWADGFSLFFSADGVPVSVQSDCFGARILSFVAQ